MENCEDKCKEFKIDLNNINKVKCAMLADDEVIRLSELFKAIGDPTRIKIIFALSMGEMCVCDIAESVGMTQSAISHQLRILRTMKLLKYKKEGKSVIYSLDDEHIQGLFREGLDHVKHG